MIISGSLIFALIIIFYTLFFWNTHKVAQQVIIFPKSPQNELELKGKKYLFLEDITMLQKENFTANKESRNTLKGKQSKRKKKQKGEWIYHKKVAEKMV